MITVYHCWHPDTFALPQARIIPYFFPFDSHPSLPVGALFPTPAPHHGLQKSQTQLKSPQSSLGFWGVPNVLGTSGGFRGWALLFLRFFPTLQIQRMEFVPVQARVGWNGCSGFFFIFFYVRDCTFLLLVQRAGKYKATAPPAEHPGSLCPGLLLTC